MIVGLFRWMKWSQIPTAQPWKSPWNLIGPHRGFALSNADLHVGQWRGGIDPMPWLFNVQSLMLGIHQNPQQNQRLIAFGFTGLPLTTHCVHTYLIYLPTQTHDITLWALRYKCCRLTPNILRTVGQHFSTRILNILDQTISDLDDQNMLVI